MSSNDFEIRELKNRIEFLERERRLLERDVRFYKTWMEEWRTYTHKLAKIVDNLHCSKCGCLVAIDDWPEVGSNGTRTNLLS